MDKIMNEKYKAVVACLHEFPNLLTHSIVKAVKKNYGLEVSPSYVLKIKQMEVRPIMQPSEKQPESLLPSELVSTETVDLAIEVMRQVEDVASKVGGKERLIGIIRKMQDFDAI